MMYSMYICVDKFLAKLEAWRNLIITEQYKYVCYQEGSVLAASYVQHVANKQYEEYKILAWF